MNLYRHFHQFKKRLRSLGGGILALLGVVLIILIASPFILVGGILQIFNLLFFGGRLGKVKITASEFQKELERLLEFEGQATNEATEHFDYWYLDYFLVPFLDETLREIQTSITAIEDVLCVEYSDESGYKLHPKTKAVIEESIEKLKRLQE